MLLPPAGATDGSSRTGILNAKHNRTDMNGKEGTRRVLESDESSVVPLVAEMWPCARLGLTVHAYEEAPCPSTL